MDTSNFADHTPELEMLDVATMRGLEIGPLAKPRVRKSEGPVFYLDHMSTKELRVKYENNETLRPQINSLVDVDFVQREGETLSEVLGPHAPFDYVIASHVIEHIPNLIGWLNEIAGVLRPGGILSLIVPDKRYCFDINRTPTEMSNLIDVYLRDLRNPSYQQIFDNFSRTVTIDGMVDTVGLWNGTVDYSGVVRTDVPNPARAAFQTCLNHRDHPDNPIDIHCHVFTPDSFLRLLAETMSLGLITFEVVSFSPTKRNELEFHASLRKVDRQVSAEELGQRLLSSIPLMDQSCNAHSGSELVSLSPFETKLIAVKRRVATSLRYARARLLRSPTLHSSGATESMV